MNTNTRTYNTIFNAFANVGAQIITMIVSFMTRIVFIKAFGENYLGISGLFSNILSVLSLAELGVSSAIIYCMYKPIADKNYQKIAALMNYYKKLYTAIGVTVAVLGLILVPFLKILINIPGDIGNVTFYYLLYLLNTVSSYFLVYKTSILLADQKNYIIKICNLAVLGVQFCALSAVAYIYRNFYIYLILQIAFSILNNLICSKIAEKKYPFINDKAELDKKEKKQIWTNIISMFSYQIGNVFLNNTDNILISVLVNTATVGFYSNYVLFIYAVNVFVQLIFGSVQASIGNLAAAGNEEKQFEIFKVLQLLSFWICLFSTVSFAVLFQDSIKILYGAHYLLEYKIALVCSFNFYMLNILQPIYCFRNTVGLFKQTKMIMVFTGIINLILSVIWGKLWGLFGILLATGVARIITNFWYEPIKLFKIYFKKPVSAYFIKQVLYAIVTVLVVWLMVGLCNAMENINFYVRYILKILLCIIIPNGILSLIFWKRPEFVYLKNKILKKK